MRIGYGDAFAAPLKEEVADLRKKGLAALSSGDIILLLLAISPVIAVSAKIIPDVYRYHAANRAYKRHHARSK